MLGGKGRHILILLCLLVLLLGGGSSETAVKHDTLLRLHVRANSNSPLDQAVKFQVRDAVLVVLDKHLQKAGSVKEAQEEIQLALPEVFSAASTTLAAAGFDYPVRAELSQAVFPTRMYGDRVYRAGTYQALQIYLGEGGGENWWCVLFPPLCFIEAPQSSSGSAVPVAGRDALPPKPRSRLFEWWQRLVRESPNFPSS